jgi:exopolysaccharide biosynthesis polyprenyl glycosylphosphotransferase
MTSNSKSVSFWLVILPNILLLYLSLYISYFIRYHGQAADLGSHYTAFTPVHLLWLVVFFIHGLFEVTTFRRFTSIIFNLVSAMLVNLLVAITYFYLQPNLILTPRRFLLIHIGVSFLLILIWDLLVKYVLKNKLIEGVYLFSFEGSGQELEAEIKNHDYLGYRVLGNLNEQTLEQVTLNKNSSIILPDNLHANPSVLKRFYEFRKLGIAFYNYKDFYENLLRKVHLSELSEMWFLENIAYKEKRFYNFLKRVVDVLAGILLFPVFLLSFPLVALALALDSKGPVLFSQKRVGKNGNIFNIYKFRSMTTITDTVWTKVNDPRITRVGNILRKTRIDELPQVINLIMGNISLVGPRPEQPGIVEQLREQIPFYDERHLVKPGLTGWAQLNIYAGSLEETKLKLQYDLYYIKHRSFLFDLEIILKTVYYIFTWQGR